LIAVLYALPYPLLGTAFPIGWDSPVYVWWTRSALADGLSSSAIAARPGTIGLLATASSVFHVQPSLIVAASLPVLVASVALAAAALIRGLGEASSPWSLVTAVAVAASLWPLAAGYVSTLVFAAEFLAALTVLAMESSRRSTVIAGLLLGAAGSAHPLFMAWAVCMAIPALIGCLLVSTRSRASAPFAAGALATGAGLTVVALVATGGLHAQALEFSGDQMLKATNLGGEVVAFHQMKMYDGLPFFLLCAFAALPSLHLLGRAKVWLSHERSTAAIFPIAVLIVWLVSTLVAIPVLAAGIPVPAQRLVIFCLPLPMLAAVGVTSIVRRPAGDTGSATSWRRRGLIAGALFAAWVVVAIAVVGWSSEARYSVSEASALDAQTAVGRAVAGAPASRPVVVAIDGSNDRVIAKQETLIRMTLPADRISDVHFYVGSLAGLARDTLQLTGVVERDRLARRHWPEIRSLLAERPLMLGVSGRDAPAGWERLGPHVYVHQRSPAVTAGGRAASVPNPDPNPWWPVALVLAVMFGIMLAGWPVARWFVGARDLTTAFALSPALGVGVVIYASLAVGAVGVHPSSAAGQMCVLLFAGGIALIPAVKARTPRTA